MHIGVAQILGLLRHRYWIPHGRTAGREILRSYAACYRHEGGPYMMPSMPPLQTNMYLKLFHLHTQV